MWSSGVRGAGAYQVDVQRGPRAMCRSEARNKSDFAFAGHDLEVAHIKAENQAAMTLRTGHNRCVCEAKWQIDVTPYKVPYPR